MRQYFTYDETRPEKFIYTTMLFFACSLLLFGCLSDTPYNIAKGLLAILRSQAGLITDSIVVGGMGAAFVNAGVVMLVCIACIRATGLSFSGISIACVLLMAGFALFGKNVCNISPILLGGWLYAKVRGQHFGRYLYITLFGTALAPVVTEVAVISSIPYVPRTLLGIGIGVGIGFILPAIAAHTVTVHQGYNLYNVGFASGMVGVAIVSLFKSFGYTFDERFLWSSGNNLRLAVLLFLQFAVLALTGFFCNRRSFRNVAHLARHSGRAVADFVILDGYAVTLVNMGLVGAMATAYVLVVGGDLNGPTIGGIYTVCGFGAFGKHFRNIVPIVLGIVLLSFVSVWTLSQPGILLAALFSTALAPIAGEFGWKWGLVAGALHVSVVRGTGILHGGLNLYNNGFAAGLVCIVLVPLIEAFRKD